MEVAIVTRDLKFGAGIHTILLTKELRKLGVKVDVYIGHGNLKTNLMSACINQTKYDILHFQGSCFGAFGKVRVPRIVTIHSLLKTEWKYEHKKEYLFGQLLEKLTLDKASRIIVVSSILKDELIEDYQPKDEKIVVVPNGIDISEFNKYPEGEKNQVFVMSCGRNVKRKGFGTLIKACKKVNVPLKIFHGELSREDLIKAYKTASIFVCPSLYETFGFSIAEAMICKCPVVASNIPVFNRYLVFDGFTGLLFNPKNYIELSGKIRFVLGNPKLVSRMAKNAYRFVKDYYNSELMARRTLKVYESLVG